MECERTVRNIIVIGAGLGGLSAAALLARAGHRVRLLERAREPGGHARSQHEDGFVFNLGAHALYREGVAMQVLAQLGVVPSARRVTGDGSYVVSAGRLRALPYDALSMWRSDALDFSGKLHFTRALAGLGERKARALQGSSVRQWLDAQTQHAGARALLETFVRLATYSNAPDLMPADIAVRQLGGAITRGVMYVDGGWQSICDALAACARASGVDIELGCGVERIEVSEGAVRGVIAQDGRRIEADAVVAAVDPRALAALLADDPRARTWAEAAVPLRAACLDVGVDRLPHPERFACLSTEAPLYYANHSKFARLAPDGASVLQLVRYLAPGEDGREAEAELRDFLEQIQPGAYARARVKRFLPNLVVHNDVPGAARARAEHPDLRGLHLVGDYASGRELLTDAVLDSARAAAERISAQAEAGRAGILDRRSPPRRARRPMAEARPTAHTDPRA